MVGVAYKGEVAYRIGECQLSLVCDFDFFSPAALHFFLQTNFRLRRLTFINLENVLAYATKFWSLLLCQ